MSVVPLAVSTSRLLAIGMIVGALGCRNNQTQTDIIQREMRHQEDQIYALQDYLTEYQQLLCEARAENEALRQQVVRKQFREGSPQDRDAPPVPPLEPPPPPKRNAPEMKIDEQIEMTLPEAPPLDVEPPSAPPLEGSTSATESKVASEVVPANFEEEISPERKTQNNPVASRHGPSRPKAAADIAALAMRAAVSHGGDDEGPRVLVDVLPLAANGEPAELKGALSLMFLDPRAIGDAKDLARWDFAADELTQFAKDTSHGTTFVFPLQLPAGVPMERPVELWVRAVSAGGKKVLTHASIDFERTDRVVADERVKPRKSKKAFPVRQASAEAPLAIPRPTEPKPGVVTNTDGWQIARPGDVQDRAAQSHEGSGEWRTATQPVPLVESRPARPDPLDEYQSHDRYGTAAAAASEPQELPAWLPERPRVASPPVDHILSPPAWSAIRR